jgi:DNA polymerase V
MSFALVDCNNFFSSCEEVFNPKLKKKPLVILSSNDGIIVARSQKAKALGIQMGEPAFLYRDRAERGEIQMLSCNFALYADLSARVMQILEGFSPHMEIYSIDEAFFQVEEDSLVLSQKMREKVKRWTGIPISIGIAPTKTLAKLANQEAKKSPEGVYELRDSSAIFALLEKSAPEDIWGIGANLGARLKAKGIHTARELIDCNDSLLQNILGVTGMRTVFELRGVVSFSISEEFEKKQSMTTSRSFGNVIFELVELQEAVATFASHAGEKLREQKSEAGFLSVFVRTKAGEHRVSSFTLPAKTSYTPELIRLSKKAVSLLFREGMGYKKAGVVVGDFSDEGTDQLDLFVREKKKKKKARAMRVVDEINERYDHQAVQFAAMGIDPTWKVLSTNRSPNYTTSWNELLTIKD